MAAVTAPAPGGVRQRVLHRRVRRLVAATITYNAVEASVALAAGTVASSGALVAFGLDSIIEVASAAAVAWQFSARDAVVVRARERRTLKIIAMSFFALAAYVSVDSLRALTGGGEAGPSRVGIVLAALSLAVMPLASWLQRRTGRELGSASAVADSKQTMLCTYMSVVLLTGLAVNALFGWGRADSVAALVIAAIAVWEGVRAWRGEGCCAPTGAAATTPPAGEKGCGCGPGCADACCIPPVKTIDLGLPGSGGR
jgi:divalent metal cation (Fe/Co/Zn/Cd) transporter